MDRGVHSDLVLCHALNAIAAAQYQRAKCRRLLAVLFLLANLTLLIYRSQRIGLRWVVSIFLETIFLATTVNAKPHTVNKAIVPT